MDKLINYICDELEEIERKAEKGKLSMQEVQYADTLAHMKKNLLKAGEMMGEEYSEASYYARGRGRNARRDSRGRYMSDGYNRRDGGYNREYNRDGGSSYAADEVISSLYEIMDDMPEGAKQDAKRLIQKIEKM